jgi:diguanylate cyclase (GGDEF)-like protein
MKRRNQPNSFKYLINSNLSIIIALFLTTGKSSAAEIKLTYEETKVHYTIEIAKQITWPNEKTKNSLNLFILGKDSRLEKAFLERQGVRVRNLPLKIKAINQMDENLERIDILYVTKRFRSQMESIFLSTKVNTLIISDGRTSTKFQMISLVDKSEKIKLRLNRKNLSSRGFQVSVALMKLAGNKADLAGELNEKEKKLKALTNLISDRENELTKQNKILEKKALLLDVSRRNLERQKKLLSSTKKELNITLKKMALTQREIQTAKSFVIKQDKILQEKQLEIQKKSDEMTRLLNKIEENKKALSQQLSDMEEQKNIIQNKNKTITEQRGIMILTVASSLFFLLILYFLYKRNQERRTVNRKLTTLNDELFKLASTDSLTGLLNRRHFTEDAEREIFRKKRKGYLTVLLMIDIDFFKSVNDEYGHAMGDQVIKSVANILTNGKRKYDLVGRWGGEEFVMMLVDCDEQRAYEISQRLCEVIADSHISHQEKSIQITISVGLSSINVDDQNLESVLARADKALYQAKSSGRNQVKIYPSST